MVNRILKNVPSLLWTKKKYFANWCYWCHLGKKFRLEHTADFKGGGRHVYTPDMGVQAND